jgi:hypothetical protein
VSTLLRDLIDIPTEVHKSDFVVSLADGVQPKLLNNYVVTPQLADCFDRALKLIRSSLTDHASKGAYLHGSFGSGKSHYMSVLYQLLAHDPGARAIEELAPVIDAHDSWLAGKRFLEVPLHMIAKPTMEAAILGGYVDRVQHLHPGASLPAVYQADARLANARNLRARMGDTAFFAQLQSSRADDEGWGDLATGWDAATFDAALAAGPHDPRRQQLVVDLIQTFYEDVPGLAKASGEGFVNLDEGLDLISRHARDLGYDAIILFLDELILWLASRMGDPAFVTAEGPKVAKLVEAAAAERPVPIVSFIARQRDLRDFVGEHVPGADRLNFDDILKYWEGRFDTITLEDTNLPAIIQRRILRTDAAARAEIDAAFDATRTQAERELDWLLTSDGDVEAFRRSYPFSPALIEALVALASVTQRERTALRVLQQVLVDHRDDLALGDLVPMGDLYDVIAVGDEPFSKEMAHHFDRAKALYATKLRPALLTRHGLREADVAALDEHHRFRTEDRLVKTILLAALVPDVEPLRGLTTSRLAALNYGTITTPIAGRERTVVLEAVRELAAMVGELRVSGDEQDPTVAVQLTGVDTDAILDKAAHVDNNGTRIAKLRELIAEQLGLSDVGSMQPRYEWVWRGTRRQVDITFANLSDRAGLPDTALRATNVPKVIIDWPFDADGGTAADDLTRVENFRADQPATATLCWIPSFFTSRALKDLGELVRIDYVLAGDRFQGLTSDLAPVDRGQARVTLENQQSALRVRVLATIDQAYGVAPAQPGLVDTSLALADHVQSLDPSLDLRPPVGASLRPAFEHLLDQLLSHRYPDHPRFEQEIRKADLETTLAEVRRAAEQPDGRIEIDRPRRPALRLVANPLRLGIMHEANFVLGDHWRNHFTAREARHGDQPVTVADVRFWIDDPRPLGLPARIQNLVILAWAETTNRVFLLHGGPVTARLDALDDAAVIERQDLPDEDQWRTAVSVAGKVFGIPGRPIPTSTGVAQLRADVVRQASEARPSAVELRTQLAEVVRARGLGDDAARLSTAQAAVTLLDRLTSSTADPVAVLATCTAPSGLDAVSRSVAKAAEVAGALRDTNWALLATAGELSGDLSPESASLTTMVDDALTRDERVTALAPVLRQAIGTATRLVTRATRGERASVPNPEPTPPPVPPIGPVTEATIEVRISTKGSLDERKLGRLVDSWRRQLQQEWGAGADISWSTSDHERSGGTR